MAKQKLETASEPETAVSGSGGELATRMAMVVDLFDTKSMAAKTAGLSPEQLARQVKGLNRPFFDSVARLALAKGVSLDWLATGAGPMYLRERAEAAGGETAPFDPGGEVLLGNLVTGLELFLVREDLVLDPAPKARLTVLLYRMLHRRRRDLDRQGLPVPDELRIAGHPVDIAADPDLADIIHLAG